MPYVRLRAACALQYEQQGYLQALQEAHTIQLQPGCLLVRPLHYPDLHRQTRVAAVAQLL